MARTTSAWLGLYSMVTVVAGRLTPEHRLPVRQAVWYHKSHAHHRAPARVDLYALLHVTDESRQCENPLRTAETCDRDPV